MRPPQSKSCKWLELRQRTRWRTSTYVCGITPYDTTHLGHLFTYAMADALMRYLENRGVRVTYVQNLTDEELQDDC